MNDAVAESVDDQEAPKDSDGVSLSVVNMESVAEPVTDLDGVREDVTEGDAPRDFELVAVVVAVAEHDTCTDTWYRPPTPPKLTNVAHGALRGV